MVRRVNIRQVMPFEGTPAYTDNTLGKNERRFKAFKEFVRQNIDLPDAPAGVPARDHSPRRADRGLRGTLLWPAAGLVPILAGIPVNLPVRTVIDAVVVDWGMRSITALPLPLNVNTLPASALRWLPGVGKKRVAAVIAKRPFGTLDEYRNVAGSSALDGLMRFG